MARLLFCAARFRAPVYRHRMTNVRLLLSALLVLAAAAVACNSAPPSAPSAPTAITSDADARSGDARTASVEISGTVGRLSGTCPDLRFVVGRVVVQTNRATVFSGATCSAVVTGAGVVARGSRQADGSLAATSITFRSTTTRTR
jgi:hypothetical protein